MLLHNKKSVIGMVEMLMHFMEGNRAFWKSCVNCAQSAQLLKREIQLISSIVSIKREDTRR